jgi:ubiquinone/menaquinone biosynthesis C-methylase UbiE
MKDYLNYTFEPDNPEFISIQDELPFWSAPFGMKLLDTIKLKKNINVLDIGSGFGFPLIETAQRLGKSCKVFGLDPWKPALERIELKIKKLGISNIKLVEGYAEELQFENNFFDLIISNNGINNVNDMDKVFGECYRTIKREGQFVFTLNLKKTMIEFYNIFEKVLLELDLSKEIERMHEHIHAKRKPEEEIVDKLHNAGYIINSVICHNFQYRFTDAEAMFNYSMIKCWFLPAWVEIVPRNMREKVFTGIEEELNAIAKKNGEIILTIPFAVFDCTK